MIPAWSQWDTSLKIVSSFDVVIAGSTLLWFLVVRRREWPRRIELRCTAAYAAILLVYLISRAEYGAPSYI